MANETLCSSVGYTVRYLVDMPYIIQRGYPTGLYRGDKRLPLTLWSYPAVSSEQFFLDTPFLNWSLLNSTKVVSP
jgi:hypothetical protein